MPLMNIYVSHSRTFDFRHQLYEPLLESPLAVDHHLILPHQHSDSPYPLEKNIKNIDLVVAEVSFVSTGQGIELGLAHAAGKPIICFYKNGSSPSQSLSLVTHQNYSYFRVEELIRQLTEKIS